MSMALFTGLQNYRPFSNCLKEKLKTQTVYGAIAKGQAATAIIPCTKMASVTHICFFMTSIRGTLSYALEYDMNLERKRDR